jgi:hypothetical protein
MSMKRQLVTSILLLLLGACNGAMRRPAKQPPADASGKTTVIYVARRGWHVDIGFGAEELELPLKSLRTEFPAVRYLFFGFGDRHYLMATNKNSPSMFAALWPGPALVLATGLTATPQQAFGDPFAIRGQRRFYGPPTCRSVLPAWCWPGNDGNKHIDSLIKRIGPPTTPVRLGPGRCRRA